MGTNWITVIIGALPIGYGAYTFYARVKTPEKFGKLEAMKKFWGQKAGMAIHIFGYSVVPMIVGILLIWAGFNGVNILSVLK